MYRQAILLLSYLLTLVNSAKILAVYPTPSVSHQVVFRPLMLELVKRGYDVTVITTDPIFSEGNSPENFTEIDLHDTSYKLFKEKFTHSARFGKRTDIFAQFELLTKINMELVYTQLKHKKVQDLINRKEKFDLVFIEAWQRPAFIYSHLFKAPVILITSFAMYGSEDSVLGVPTHPFLFPKPLQQRQNNLTFWDKTQELYKYLWFERLKSSTEPSEINSFRELFGKNVPDYHELNNNVDMMFLNVHPMWHNNQPLPPNVINIWGIYKTPQKALPTDLQNYLDSSKNGVIYLSFGSNVLSSVLSPDRIQIFIRVFARLNYDVLWKWEKSVLPGKPENVKISKWLPQSDLLRHPKVKLFITQGGLQSTDEAITAGVPTIGVPFLGDQWMNIEKHVYFKIGVQLDMETLTEEKLETAIYTILNDTSYRDNVKNLRTLMNDQPESALDRAVWWTEYVLRHGGAKHLRAVSANMSWYEYYELEFLFKLACAIIVLLVLVAVILYLSYISIVPKRKLKSC